MVSLQGNYCESCKVGEETWQSGAGHSRRRSCRERVLLAMWCVCLWEERGELTESFPGKAGDLGLLIYFLRQSFALYLKLACNS